SHHRVADLDALLEPGDVLVVNDTRVVPARLLGRREPSGGAVECLLLRRIDVDRWDALVHPGQKLKPGSRAVFDGGGRRLELEVLDRHYHGRRTVRLTAHDGAVDAAVDAIGHVPLPPYIRRADRPLDADRYQTVYAAARGSVAAPTAGLHFTPALLERLRARGVERHAITLHVGYGTFEPVRTEEVEAHRVAAERYTVPATTAAAVNDALDEGRRVVAVGTTTTRTLEAVARAHGGRLEPGAGETDLYIHGDFDFQVVGGLLTNFHLPRSSLLLLVCAFAGRNAILDAYRDAVERRYRFYSYGDAMLIL
ncbi:MAG: tRNA preQ1(34) S-adenosylmethionine ribosyltransferase-isomerase QueA, partial [Acidobacteria bacterium]|nr:tRNA preQ1(34) S-adenosylmethionine ribosyltransferase-isomerase QueA [Acidobacteriota bacterium]